LTEEVLTLEPIWWILLALMLGYGIYALIPDLLAHRLGVGAWKRHYGAGVVLTFDDGPDPQYTPLFLAFLKERNITACFFLIGEKALKYPELVMQIKEEGHQIGCHGYAHKHGFILSPRKTWALWSDGIHALENILGEDIHFVRAPWGAVTLPLLIWCRVKGKKLVGWTVKGWDWKANRRPEDIATDILRKVDHGAIALLHDGGGEPNAPNNTLQALNLLERDIRTSRMVPIVTLELPDWTLGRRIAFRLWEQWEKLYAKRFHVERISSKNGFRIAQGTYHGPDLLDENGELLAKTGDTVAFLHLENIHFQKMGTDPRRIAWHAVKLIRRSMVELAEFVADHPIYGKLEVFVGVTLLNRGVKGLGFHVEEGPGQHPGIVGGIQQIVYRVYNPGEQQHTGEKKSTPKVVWISRRALMEKYKAKSGELHSEDFS
jgi:peptidoglycan/xylan/chitin deacetylase (PgdA/CDA1 family)